MLRWAEAVWYNNMISALIQVSKPFCIVWHILPVQLIIPVMCMYLCMYSLMLLNFTTYKFKKVWKNCCRNHSNIICFFLSRFNHVQLFCWMRFLPCVVVIRSASTAASTPTYPHRSISFHSSISVLWIRFSDRISTKFTDFSPKRNLYTRMSIL